MAEIRARIVVINSDGCTGIGVEVYAPVIYANVVQYIASIYVDSVTTKSEGIRIAIKQLRDEYGADTPIFVKTLHKTVKFRWIPMEGVRLRLEPRSNYSDTTALAEDAIKRKTTITERI